MYKLFYGGENINTLCKSFKKREHCERSLISRTAHREQRVSKGEEDPEIRYRETGIFAEEILLIGGQKATV